MCPGCRFLLLAGFVLTLAAGLGASGATHLVLEAGDVDRAPAVVGVQWPEGVPSGDLRGPDGREIPVQIEGGLGWFVEPALPRGTTRRYSLGASASALAERRPSQRTRADGVDLRLGDLPVATYVTDQGRVPSPAIPSVYARGGYLHPIRTPAGRIITDDYPANHLHHHGFWTAWTKTRFEGRQPDFWNMGERTGRVDATGIRSADDGAVFASLRAGQVFTDLGTTPGLPVLHEAWTIRLYRLPVVQPFGLIDLESIQECAGSSPLELPRYYYGGFGYRGPWNWNGRTNLLYLDSNRVTNRVAANETRVRWFWAGGLVDGALAGIAVLGHPENFRAPQPVRVHPNEPFVCWSPSQLGSWEIRPGQSLRSRYRLVPWDGPPDPAVLDRLWADFATPARARFE